MPGRRAPKLAIIGAGAVGTSMAYAALIRGVARTVVLHDINAKKVRAAALDMAHGSQFFPEATVDGSDDVEITRNSDIVMVTAGAKQSPGQTRMDLAASTADLMTRMLPPLVERSPNAIFVLVTNPVDVITQVSLKISGLPRNQLFGSGTVLDTSRLRFLVAEHCGVAVRNVHAYICGEHGDSQIPIWGAANIGGVPLVEWERQTGKLGEQARDFIAERVVNAAYEVIEGKGATNFAIGLASLDIMQAILRDEHRILPISSYLDDWYGIKDVCMSVPTVVDRMGAGQDLVLPLSDGELGAMHDSAQIIRDTVRGLGF